MNASTTTKRIIPRETHIRGPKLRLRQAGLALA